MKMKKMISTTLAISLLALSLTGCNTKEQNQAVNGVSDGKVQIEFWNALTGKNEEVVKGFVDEFNAQSENVEVKMISQGFNYARSNASISICIFWSSCKC